MVHKPQKTFEEFAGEDQERYDGAWSAFAIGTVLERLGVREEHLVLTEASFDPAPRRRIVTAPHWTEADCYALFLGVGKQQIDRSSLARVGGRHGARHDRCSRDVFSKGGVQPHLPSRLTAIARGCVLAGVYVVVYT